MNRKNREVDKVTEELIRSAEDSESAALAINKLAALPEKERPISEKEMRALIKLIRAGVGVTDLVWKEAVKH